MKTIAVTIDEATLEALDRIVPTLAKGSGRRIADKTVSGRERRASRSEVVRTALQQYLGRLEQEAREHADQAAYARHQGQVNRDAARLIQHQAKV